MYEESLRMPFLIRYPAGIKAGTQNNDMALNLDFPETFLDYAGAEVPSGMQGRSLRPLLEGKTPKDWRQSMYYRYWMHLADHYVPAHYGVRTRRHKLIYYYGQPLGTAGSLTEPKSPYWELFDLEKDPREMRSVYENPQYAGVVKTLKAELAKLQKLYGDEPWSAQSA
jgi:arylsulfatase A-like enzyme